MRLTSLSGADHPGQSALQLDARYLVGPSIFWLFGALPASVFAQYASSRSIRSSVCSASPTRLACSESRAPIRGWHCTGLGEPRYPCTHHGIGCPPANVELTIFYRPVMIESMARTAHPSTCWETKVLPNGHGTPPPAQFALGAAMRPTVLLGIQARPNSG
jgi:hypothetical protein